MADSANSGGGRRAAFFDLDETLIRVKSMFRFLEFHLAQRGMPGAVYERIRDDLTGLAAAGWSRADTNRAYYRVYAHQPAAQLVSQGKRWFAAELAAGELFTRSVRSALRRHQSRGDLTVVVSGSFPAVVEPIARYAGVDVTLCTQPEINDGVYTGAVRTPMIGPMKATAVREVLARRHIAAEDCFAYGDHASDLPMLRSVGHPVVVGADPVLTAEATESGWAVLPTDPAPPGSLLGPAASSSA